MNPKYGTKARNNGYPVSTLCFRGDREQSRWEELDGKETIGQDTIGTAEAFRQESKASTHILEWKVDWAELSCG